jgi:hypothetical protein
MRKKYRRRLFENMMGIIFGSKRKKVMKGWKIFHSEELHNLHSSLG